MSIIIILVCDNCGPEELGKIPAAPASVGAQYDFYEGLAEMNTEDFAVRHRDCPPDG